MTGRRFVAGRRPEPDHCSCSERGASHMKLIMKGHNTAPVQYVTVKEIRNAGGISKGYFSRDWWSNTEDDKLFLKFTLKILVETGLDEKTQKDVLTHERQHFTDFKALVGKLQVSIVKALKA